MNLSGSPIILSFTFAIFFSVNHSLTAEPNPPAIAFSSTVIQFDIFEENFKRASSSKGFTNIASTTQTLMSSLAKALPASIALQTQLPTARIKMSDFSVPNIVSDLPIGRVLKFLSTATPTMLPRGYLIATGLLQYTPVESMCLNMFSSRGAIMMIFGRWRKYERSNTP